MHRAGDDRFSAGHPIRTSHVQANGWPDRRDRRVARDRNRSEHGGLQRRQRAPAQAPPISGSRSIDRVVAPVSGHQHPAGLAVTGPIHRRQERESIVRRALDLAGSHRNVDRPRRRSAVCRTATGRGAPDLVEPLPPARREGPLRSASVARRRRARQSARRRAQQRVLEARVQRGSEHRRQDDRAQRFLESTGFDAVNSRWSASSTPTSY